jgi:hypothetical protein
MTTIAERVAAGAEWLDEHRPGWVWRIDLDTLDLGDPCRCVLGQEFREVAVVQGFPSGYLAGRKVFDEDGANDWWRDTEVAAHYGFHAVADIAGGDIDDEYDDLTGAWRRLIRQRRSLGDRTHEEIAAEKRTSDI